MGPIQHKDVDLAVKEVPLWREDGLTTVSADCIIFCVQHTWYGGENVSIVKDELLRSTLSTIKLTMFQCVKFSTNLRVKAMFNVNALKDVHKFNVCNVLVVQLFNDFLMRFNCQICH